MDKPIENETLSTEEAAKSEAERVTPDQVSATVTEPDVAPTADQDQNQQQESHEDAGAGGKEPQPEKSIEEEAEKGEAGPDKTTSSEVDQLSEKSASRSTSECSTPARGSSPSRAEHQPTHDKSGFPHRAGISWRAGCKLEAKDFMEKWYPAKIVEVDGSDGTVLIHFDGWNQRYDEWLDMDSDRIRPMARHSERRERRDKAKVVVKPQAEHKLGENVFAKWTDCRMYPATIVSINSNGTYDVVFYDGFKKTVQEINVKNMPEEVQNEYARSGLLPELGKKQKQKLRELMKSAEAAMMTPESGARRRLSSGSSGSKEAGSGKSEPKSKETSPSEKAGPSQVSRANIKNVPPSKKKRLSEDSTPPGKKLKMAPPTRVNTKVKVKEFPTSKKQKDHIKPSMAKSSSAADDGNSVAGAETGGATEPVGASDVSPQPSTSTGEVKPGGHGDGGDDGCFMQMSETGEKGPAPKAFKVQGDNYPYHCKFKDCDKGFRKESLLQYHHKYYHTPDGGVVATPPIRKRRKTTSICSTDSEVSVSSRIPGSQRPIKRKRDSLASTSLTSLPDPVTEITETVADHSLDTSEVDSKTTTTEEGEGHDALAEEMLDRDGDEEPEDELDRDDVVNCICQINEESGLMIQCEVCLCWQHALCMEITAETLPSKYICYVCLNPPGVRDSARFSYDQDWLKQGMLARFSFLPEDPNDQKKAQIMQATHELVADMHGINNSLNATKRKLHILKNKKKFDKELHVWMTDWDAEEREQQQKEQEEEEEERRLAEAAETQPVTTDSDAEIQVTDSSITSEIQDISDANTPKGEPPVNDSTKVQDPPEEKAETSQRESKSDLEDNTPLSEMSTQEASTKKPDGDISMDEDAKKADETQAVQPEKPAVIVKSPDNIRAMCEENLLRHVDGVHSTIEEQLDLIESQVAALESAEETSGRSGDILRDLPRVKKAVHQVIGDLAKVRRMALYH